MSGVLRVSACVVACLALGAVAGGDVNKDYQAAWGDKEKHAITPATRAQLAQDLFDAAVEMVDGAAPKRPPKGKTAEQRAENRRKAGIAKLGQARKAEVMLLCRKAHEWGRQQASSTGAAAGALGLLQEVNPSARLESLGLLEKLIDGLYRQNPARNVGMAKSLADVRLQIGQERWFALQDKQAAGTLKVTDLGRELQAINEIYAKALAGINDTIATVRPYAAGKLTLERFITGCQELKTEIEDSQKLALLAQRSAAEAIRQAKAREDLEARLKKDPKDAASADRLARLCLNEDGDLAAAASYKTSASPTVAKFLAQLTGPVDKLSAADALALAQWLEKLDDNPGSRNRTGLLVRTRIYLQRFMQAARPTDDHGPAEASLKRIAAELAKAQVDEAKAKELAQAMTEELQPQVAAAPQTPDPAAPEIVKVTAHPEQLPVRPAAAPMKLETPLLPPTPTETASKDRRSIFEFGRPGYED